MKTIVEFYTLHSTSVTGTEKRKSGVKKKRQPEGASTAVSVSRDLLPLNEYEMNIFVIKESHGPAVVGVVEFFIPD